MRKNERLTGARDGSCVKENDMRVRNGIVAITLFTLLATALFGEDTPFFARLGEGFVKGYRAINSTLRITSHVKRNDQININAETNGADTLLYRYPYNQYYASGYYYIFDVNYRCRPFEGMDVNVGISFMPQNSDMQYAAERKYFSLFATLTYDLAKGYFIRGRVSYRHDDTSGLFKQLSPWKEDEGGLDIARNYLDMFEFARSSRMTANTRFEVELTRQQWGRYKVIPEFKVSFYQYEMVYDEQEGYLPDPWTWRNKEATTQLRPNFFVDFSGKVRFNPIKELWCSVEGRYRPRNTSWQVYPYSYDSARFRFTLDYRLSRYVSLFAGYMRDINYYRMENPYHTYTWNNRYEPATQTEKDLFDDMIKERNEASDDFYFGIQIR